MLAETKPGRWQITSCVARESTSTSSCCRAGSTVKTLMRVARPLPVRMVLSSVTGPLWVPMKRPGTARLVDGLVAGAGAALPSGGPSAGGALCTGRDLRDTVRAAGSLLAPEDASGLRLLASGVAAHMAISLGWGAVLG